jgi:hypothetical protein
LNFVWIYAGHEVKSNADIEDEDKEKEEAAQLESLRVQLKSRLVK